MDGLGSKPVVRTTVSSKKPRQYPGREQGVKNRVSKLSQDREQELGK